MKRHMLDPASSLLVCMYTRVYSDGTSPESRTEVLKTPECFLSQSILGKALSHGSCT